MLSKIKHNIAVQILAGVFLVLALLTLITSNIGYYQFTGAIERQYAESAFNTARTAAAYLPPDFVKHRDYASEEWQDENRRIRGIWRTLVRTQRATYIYAFVSSGKEYEDAEFIIDSINTDIYPQDHEYTSGFRFTQTDRRYLSAFRRIYDEHEEGVEISIYRPEGNEVEESGNHVAVLQPFRDENGEIIAVLGVERRMEELDNIRYRYIHSVLSAAGVLLLLVLVCYGLYLSRNLIRPIQIIADETMRFAHENTRPELPLGENITVSNEIGQLAKTIDVMEADILRYVEDLTRITREQEQTKAELNIAAQIQADMLPRDFPERKEFEIYATMTPAKEVGGDFYDFFMIDDDHLGLVMADVSGKGVPAALFMMTAKTLIKNLAQTGGAKSPAEILADVNRQLCEGNEADLFVTVWLGILEISSGKVTASNAGHEYPAVFRAGGKYELLKGRNSPAVATMEGMKFRENEFTLNPGDNLYLYTDGVAEATNSDDELYGTDRMLEALNTTLDGTAEEILASMKKSVDDFTGDAPQFDDMTMLCVRYFGSNEITLEADVNNLEQVISFIDEKLEAADCPPKTQMQIDLAAEEIFVNIAHYAYAPETGNASVRVEIHENPLSAVITFTDSGTPYDPLMNPDPDVTLSADERNVGGLGIYLVKKNMDNVSYKHKDGKNILTVRKILE